MEADACWNKAFPNVYVGLCQFPGTIIYSFNAALGTRAVTVLKCFTGIPIPGVVSPFLQIECMN